MLQHAGSVATQPGRTPTRLRRTRLLVASGLVVSPVISGVFFGAVAALLVLRGGSLGRATEIGALVGGVMFASNAIALCIVNTTGRVGNRRADSARLTAPFVRASLRRR